MEIATWITPALDMLAIVMLGAVLWHLRRDPAATWDAREQRLGEIFERLRVLVAQSEGIARDLDGTLGTHQQRLRALLDEATAAVGRVVAPAASACADDAVIERVRTLAEAAMPIEEIARRVEMPAAEVRVLVGLHAGRPATRGGAARARAATAVRA
ncbi:MAG: hypothetical protein HY271_10715 [Deltaproteobacteria bacterium]|nr:hypothetical protein [Deltaproteobacteria bacterium]